MKPGKFIVLEGVDGSGTTTQSKLLRDALSARGIHTVRTAEPTDGEIGLLIRRALRKEVGPFSWESLALLFAADRMSHVDLDSRRLASGESIVQDRYVLSSLIYQSASAGDAEDFARLWIRAVNERAPKPDLTIVLDVSPSIAQKRREERRGAEELFDDAKFQELLSLRYVMAPGLHVDGNRETSVVHEEILSIALRLFGEGT